MGCSFMSTSTAVSVNRTCRGRSVGHRARGAAEKEFARAETALQIPRIPHIPPKSASIGPGSGECGETRGTVGRLRPGQSDLRQQLVGPGTQVR